MDKIQAKEVMKLVFNMGWGLERGLYRIAMKVIDTRKRIPNKLEIEHSSWRMVCLSYHDNLEFIHFAQHHDNLKRFRKI
jgi:hypothetical protein